MTITLDTLRQGGKPALARALAQIERAPHEAATLDLLDAAFAEGRGHTLGITGPPGVGKSSMIDALIRRLRARGLSVGIIAVDPSSSRSGGALLGDRARLASVDPADGGVFARSMASRGRLGGLADLVYPSVNLMRAVFDLVIVETVGVGQSEIDVARVTDTTLLCVQPASGDSLQFIKAGIMEIPDIVVVTKADIGLAARRAASDLRSALSVTAITGADGIAGSPSVEVISSQSGEGVDALIETIITRFNNGMEPQRLRGTRMLQAQEWCADAIRSEFGRTGLDRAREALHRELSRTRRPFLTLSEISSYLASALRKLDLR